MKIGNKEYYSITTKNHSTNWSLGYQSQQYVGGPMSIQGREGYECFITFTNDYSRCDYVYLMRWKFEAFEKFKEIQAKSEKTIR